MDEDKVSEQQQDVTPQQGGGKKGRPSGAKFTLETSQCYVPG